MSGLPSEHDWDRLEIVWTHHSFRGQALVCGELILAPMETPWKLLAQPASWAYYWQSRQDKNPEWGIGAVLVLEEGAVEPALEETSLPFFGGAPFDAGHVDHEAWGEFAKALWILPELSGKTLADGLRLRFYSLDTDLDRARLQFIELARSLSSLAPLQKQTLPPFRTRSDLPLRSDWKQQLTKASATIAEGGLEKVVMSRSVRLQFDREVPWTNCLRALSDIAEESFVFALKAPSGRVFMGRSPERLLAWDQLGFAIDAIAGTRRRDGSASADLRVGQELKSSQKDRWEHSLVRVAVENLLLRFADHYEILSDQELLVLRYVQHMRTRFHAFWKEGVCRGWELLQALHPTPAVGGSPTAEAKRFIREQESFARTWFAGYIGVLSRSSAELAIGIRSALVHNETVTIFAGAGIVAGSDPEEEWTETELKMQNFLRLFQEESQSFTREADVPCTRNTINR